MLLLIVNNPIDQMTRKNTLNRQTTVAHGDGQLTITGSLLEGWNARRRTCRGKSPIGTTTGESSAGRWGGTVAARGEELDLLGSANATHAQAGGVAVGTAAGDVAGIGVGVGGFVVIVAGEIHHHAVVGQHLGEHLGILHNGKKELKKNRRHALRKNIS